MNSELITAQLLKSLEKQEGQIDITGVPGSAPAWMTARLFRHLEKIVLWVTPTAREAETRTADISFFLDSHVLAFPHHESLPFVPLLPSPVTVSQKIYTLYSMATMDKTAIIVAPVQALAERTVPKTILLDHVELLQKGEETDRDALLDWLVDVGYENTSAVRTRGQFSVRGSLIDIFPPTTKLPVRIDFFGDIVEDIRLFDPISQRSSEVVDELVILPAGELILERVEVEDIKKKVVAQAADYDWPVRRIHELLQQLDTGRALEGNRILLPFLYRDFSTIMDFLPGNTQVIIEKPDQVKTALEEYWHDCEAAYRSGLQDHRLLSPLEDLIADPESVLRKMDGHPCWHLKDMNILEERQADLPKSGTVEIDLDAAMPDIPIRNFQAGMAENILAPVTDRIRQWLDAGDRIVVAAPGRRQAERLIELFEYHGLCNDDRPATAVSAPLLRDPEKPGITICTGMLSMGFSLPTEGLTVITEEELFGSTGRRAKKARRRKHLPGDVTFEDLKIHEPVVHRDHGVGIYRGLVHMETKDSVGEFLVIEYRDGDKLYLPVDRLGLIQKYVGVEGRPPKLHKLGSSVWQLTKKKVKKAVYEIAHELVDLYASRKITSGHGFSPPDALYRQFEASFPYEETSDQAASIEEILADMQEPKPMDRLLCGDVGYGKTEIAMRAAFEAVAGGKQVAVMVPTTLLAEQHERTFSKRFEKFPVTVSALSRLKTRKEQKETVAGIADGRIDIVIGTHRLLQSDVRFKDLGCLIIDEEHRFGVRHKEQLKRLKKNVDSLALTATPIPRTLQLSLLGVRDLSVINTPPRDRLPVKTFLAEFDNTLIQGAITREIARKGQVFFVHNRIKGLQRLADHIGKLVPNARIAVSHGQMEPRELEDVMIRFVKGRIDCLVCTTIIESGLDIPSANTIIVNRADMLGIADLYQLKGRVGRASEQAYAYFLVPDISRISHEARKRLKAIMAISEAGGGFRLAMHDLQIRGAGNILGVSQSGSIADVGYDLYLELLQAAVEELKGMPGKEEVDPEVNLGVSAFIPEDYVPDVEERLILYRRFSRLLYHKEASDFMDELTDRFGPCPSEVISLLKIMEIKHMLRKLNAVRLDRSSAGAKEQIVLVFGQGGPDNPEKIFALVKKHTHVRLLLPDERLIIGIGKKTDRSEDIISRTIEALRGLVKRDT